MIVHGLRHFYVRETKTAAQTTYLLLPISFVRLFITYVCLFVCWFVGIKSEKLTDFGGFRLFGCLLEFRCTLKIIARILREVVNRERLCGTSAFCLFVCLLGE